MSGCIKTGLATAGVYVYLFSSKPEIYLSTLILWLLLDALPVYSLPADTFIQRESEDARSRAAALAESLEPGEGFVNFPDESGRPFFLESDATIHFGQSLLQWTPIIVSTADSYRAIAEAKSLQKRGVYREAIRIYRAIASMGLVESPLNGRQVGDVRIATSQINRLLRKERNRKYANIVWVLFADKSGETVIASDHHGWRFRVPGYWKFAPLDGDGSRITGGILRHTNIYISVFSEPTPDGVKSVNDLVSVWDQRRGLAKSQKNRLEFKRQVLSELNICSNKFVCQITQTSHKGGAPTGYELFLTAPAYSLHILITYKVEASQAARGTLQRIVSTLKGGLIP